MKFYYLVTSGNAQEVCDLLSSKEGYDVSCNEVVNGGICVTAEGRPNYHALMEQLEADLGKDITVNLEKTMSFSAECN